MESIMTYWATYWATYSATIRPLVVTCWEYIKQKFGYVNPRYPRVTRVVVIDDTNDILKRVKWDREVMDGHGWEHCARQLGMGDTGRVEIRLVHLFTKRRIVLYPGDYLDTAFPKPARSMYVYAMAVPRQEYDGETDPVNILGRVNKYRGNTLRCASHMFPSDDPDELYHRFEYVSTLDMFYKKEHLDFRVHKTDAKNGSDRNECEAD